MIIIRVEPISTPIHISVPHMRKLSRALPIINLKSIRWHQTSLYGLLFLLIGRLPCADLS